MRPEPYDVKIDNRMTEQLEAIQLNLTGIWTRPLGCPHHHRGDIDRCDTNGMRPCVYETDSNPFCDIFHQIIEEWRIEFEICPECCQVRPGDERVKAGMKCGFCAY